MRKEKARLFILEKLNQVFDNDSYYHCVNHALEVESACALISDNISEISEQDQEILSIAALCHDIGYSENFDNHEQLSVDFVTSNLTSFGYNDDEISLISELIFATKFPHKPKNILEQIICDADLSYLGGDSYFEQSSKLKVELEHFNIRKFQTSGDWIEYQLKFLDKHEFHTDYAIANYTQSKNQIVTFLKSKL